MKGWKTFFFNGGISALMLLAEVVRMSSDFDWIELLPEHAAPYGVIAMGLANIGLRHMTRGPAAWMEKAKDE